MSVLQVQAEWTAIVEMIAMVVLLIWYAIRAVFYGVATASQLDVLEWPVALSAFVLKIVFVVFHFLLAWFLYYSAHQRSEGKLRVWFYIRLLIGLLVFVLFGLELFHIVFTMEAKSTSASAPPIYTVNSMESSYMRPNDNGRGSGVSMLQLINVGCIVVLTLCIVSCMLALHRNAQIMEKNVELLEMQLKYKSNFGMKDDCHYMEGDECRKRSSIQSAKQDAAWNCIQSDLPHLEVEVADEYKPPVEGYNPVCRRPDNNSLE
ncbi:hypothetical protein Ocin01_10193 [Orchesella cincta]|uniref:Uncharacterized protein n=1 Tax=Orchesella cincta TaxID=48709 RepID=A0A1D2MTX1_ORCCI|nr:hypothetical protein Ocin01_10193 [Orchesella cincta]